MARGPEQRLIEPIKKALLKRGAIAIKLHGDAYVRAWPDLLVITPSQGEIPLARYVWLEVKAPGKVPTPLQQRIIDRLRTKGATVAVVYSVEEALTAVYPETSE